MNINNALHTGPRLLIPTLIDAMVVDDQVLSEMRGDWARNKAKYNSVPRYGAAFPRDIAVARSERYSSSKPPEKGVHLQWLLPKGLASGKLSKEKGLEFPLVPNRWLVVRNYYDSNHQLQLKGWVVQSDHIRSFDRDYDGPYTLVEEDGTIEHRQIGKVIPWEEWVGEKDYNHIGLTAIGYQDFTFTSYTVNNKNVFSFHDDLADLNTDQDYSIGYVITGWYGDPTEDPLFQITYDQVDLLEKIAALRFDIGAEDGFSKAEAAFETWSEGTHEELSPLVLCHGTIHSIEYPWKAIDKDGRPQKNLNQADSVPDIIVGNSSFDTLATFIGQKLKEKGLSEEQMTFASELLYAFDQKLLNEFIKPDGDHLLDSYIHKSWFIGSASGSYWEIVQDNMGEDEEEKKHLKRKLQDALHILAPLNKAQKELDRQAAIKNARLQHLHTALFATKSERSEAWRANALKIDIELQKINAEINSLTMQVNQLAIKIRVGLNIEEERDENNFELKQYSAPNYWEPDDPVILIHAAKTNEKHSFDSSPKCRYSGQWIDHLILRENEAKFSPNIPVLPNGNKFPKELAALIKEFVLLNPNFTPHYFSSNLESTQKQQTLIWNSEQLAGLEGNRLMQAAGFRGINESVAALRPDFRSFTTFTLPWSPLFMDWVVYFFPDMGKETVADSKAQDAMLNWQLEEDRMDYSIRSLANVPPINDDIHKISWTIQGRSLISSHLPKVLIARLKEFQQELIDVNKQESIDTIISLLKGFDLITQRLSGFNEYMQRYDINNQVPLPLLKDEQIDTSGLKNKGFGMPIGNLVEINHIPLNQYFPIRSGHLLVHHVRIVDDFGIGFYPTGRSEPTDGNTLIVQDNSLIYKGKGMNHEEIANTGLVQLTPRITQPARIKMEWIDADDDALVTQEAQNSPVCGWIIPNHLDKSLMIFDAEGKLQGSLIFFKRDNRFHIKKALDPISANPDRFEIKNRHLAGFINELLALEDKDTALSAFLEQIDKTTWITDPLGARNQRGLSALIGRPMALVRASVTMELQGLPIPAFDFEQPEAYDLSKNANPLGLLDIAFPYFVGSSILPNNGLIGYFDEKDDATSYRTFHVVTDHSSVDTDYITDQQVLKTKLNHAYTASENQDRKKLSLLLDYRGSIHLISGLLPVFELNLAPKYTRDALSNMEVTFRTGPLITDPAKLRMPKPNDISGKLSWIYKSGVHIWQDDEQLPQGGAWENKNLKDVLTDAHYPERRHQLSEGWLKLADALKEK